MSYKSDDIAAGEVWGSLWILSYEGIKGGHKHFKCSCKCGKVKVMSVYSILKSKTKSCGCISHKQTALRRFKHGGLHTKEYHTWQRMKQRCYNETCEDFKEYGGRGIKVCDSWIDSFENFLKDIGKAPEKISSLDRIDVNGNYEPSNCRWATPQTQAYNQRIYKSSSTGKTGVTWSKKGNRYEARISKDNKEYYLGYFKCFDDAVKAREEAEMKYYGYLKHGSYFREEYNA